MTTESKILRIGDGSDWRFVNGDWQDGEDNLLAVPAELRRSDGYCLQGHHYAFCRRLCYRDVRVRFEFRLNPHSDAGIILRAADESHFYLLHFPNCGQAYRAQHFWAALSRMDETGYLKIVKLDMVRRVPSDKGVWLSADLTLAGGRVSVRVGEHGHFEVEDNTYAGPGCVGVYCCGDADIRQVAFEGQASPSCPWKEEARQPTNWFHPCPDTEYGLWQHPSNLLRLADDEPLMNYAVQERPYEGEVTPLLTRSRDGGRTWSEPEVLKLVRGESAWEPARLHLTPSGRLIALVKPGDDYLTAESEDGGRTWSEPAVAGIGPTPPRLKTMGAHRFLNLADGSMVLFCLGGYRMGDEEHNIHTWGSWHCQAYACRSTDDGRTWSPPVNMDNPGCDAEGRQLEGNLDLTEVCGIQMDDGRIMALIRPIYSPWMWESWSSDGGATWGSCLRGPFPGYATPNMLRTSCGAVLVAHRLPGLTIHCSLDGGHTWDEGTVIDGALWVMGSMIEMEPDVVLYVYWDSFESLMRAQFIRVTPKGLEPAGVP